MTTLLLNAATTTGAGDEIQIRITDSPFVFRSFQAVGVMSASTGTAVIKIQVSNDGVNCIDMGTISLALTTSESSDGFAVINTWQYFRANVTTLTSNGTVSVFMKP